MLKIVFRNLHILCSVAAMHLSFIGNSQVAPPTNSSHKTTGHIREMKVYSLTEIAADNKTKNDSLLTSCSRYDKKGNILENDIYAEGSLVKKEINKYDSRNRLIEEIEFDGQGMVHQRKAYDYNNRDSLAEIENYEIGNELDNKVTFIYNDAGKKTTEVHTKEEGDVIKKIIYRYDERGNLMEEKTLERKDSLVLMYQWKYDSFNNRTEEIRKNGSRQEWRFVYTHNDFNQPVKEEHIYTYETSNSSIAMQYNAAHQLTSSTTYDYKKNVIRKSVFTYVNGKLTASEENNAVTKFEYDSIGNKTGEKILMNNELISDKTFDKHGNILIWEHYKSGDVTGFTEHYTYDNATHNLLKLTKLDKFKSLIEENEYKYDSKGNMIEEINRDSNSKIHTMSATLYQYY